jgi:RNA polymerase sigma-70 factor (ECF subfamily)
VIHYREVVRRFVSRYTQDADRAEDMCQEAFLRVYRARSRYQPTAGFRTWLFTIATRLCLNDLRSRGRERKVIVPLPRASDLAGEPEEDFLDSVEDRRQERVPDALVRRELEEAIDAAILSLPPSQRCAILLLRFEELSYKEIAGALGISVMAVKSLINRGREGLRERLGKFLGGRSHGE